jgi:hypothetical protein
MISSLASNSERFFDTLFTMTLAAVYAGSMTLCRWVECAEKLTTRAHSARRSRGSAERTQCTIPITPWSMAVRHWSSVSCSKLPAALGPGVCQPHAAAAADHDGGGVCEN